MGKEQLQMYICHVVSAGNALTNFKEGVGPTFPSTYAREEQKEKQAKVRHVLHS